MSYITIKDFMRGLDARKHRLSLPAGTLTKLENAHITTGGEIEKRKAFTDIPLPAGTFGAQETLTGIVVFGSAELTVSSPAIYQQLIHPNGADVVMTGIVASDYFNGKVYAVSTWGNGDTLISENETILGDFYVGKQGIIENTPYTMALDLAAKITASGEYNVTGPVDDGLYFLITGGSVGNVTSVKYKFNRALYQSSLSNDEVELLTGPVPWNTSNNQTATDIKTQFDGRTWVAPAGGGYPTLTMTVLDNRVTIGGAVNPLDSIEVTTDGDATVFVKTQSAVFDVASIPTTSSASPFSVAKSISGMGLDFELVTSGSAAKAPLSAVGQFTITGGTANAAAKGTITVSALPANNDTVAVGTTTYTFVNLVTGIENQVKIGATNEETLGNLVAAINGESGSGTKYSPGTLANESASASAVTASATTLTANKGGLAGNSIALSKTGAALAVTAFAGGGSYSFATLTSDNTNPGNGSTVVVNGKTYTFLTVLTTADGAVLIGADANATLLNLYMAINLALPSAAHYGSLTTQHTTVTATDLDTTNHRLRLEAINSGVAGDAYTLTLGGTTHLTASAFTAGGTDASRISGITVGSMQLLSTYVPFSQTALVMAADLTEAINAYSGTSGFMASNNGGTVTIETVSAGAAYNQAEVKITALGTVCVASCSVVISPAVGEGVSVITGNLASVNMLTSTITYQDTGHASESLAQFCARIAANINANTATSGYLATSVSNQLYVSAATIANTDVLENINLTTSAKTGEGVEADLTVGVSTLALLSWTKVSDKNETGHYESSGQPVSARITVLGGISPYIYVWSRKTTGEVGAISSIQQTSELLPTQWWKTPTKDAVALQKPNETWVCTVTDQNGNTGVSPDIYIL